MKKVDAIFNSIKLNMASTDSIETAIKETTVQALMLLCLTT